MKSLRLIDFIISLIFGSVLFSGFFIFQKYKANNTQSKIAHSKNIKAKKNYLIAKFKKEQTLEFSSTMAKANNAPISNLNQTLYSESTKLNDMNENSNEQMQNISDFMNKKTEDFITNELNLSFSFSDKVITAQSNLRNQLYQNNRLLEETGVSPEAQELNQKALTEYQNEMRRILGDDGFQKFSEWKQKTTEELMAKHPGEERNFEFL